MWVHVSRSFDVHRLTKEIIESAKVGKCSQINNLDVLQTILKESVSKRKNFLLVLDDIWCEDSMQWDQLLSPLNEVGGKGSKIIITTRMEQVASILQVEKVIPLEELKDDDCWKILKHYAFNNHEEIIEDQKLENVGNQIIRKVKYSPLALRIVGSSLRQRSVNEWEKILKRDMLKETRDVLLFSFHHLPSHLQRCFAYCSLFPKGYKFRFGGYHKENLIIPLWISQGFIENTSGLTLEEEGLVYIEELLSYSFFEKHKFYGYFVIHDLLHDLAEEVSKKQCHRIEHGDSLNIPTTCIHLSILRWESTYISDILKLRYLRTLLILDFADFNDYIDIYRNLTKLRALYVDYDWQLYFDNGWSWEELSNLYIDKLKHLRYLCVRYCKKLPSSLAKLYHLQFFHLTTDIDDKYLKAHTLPQGFGNLINLRTLKFCGRGELDYLYYNSKEISIEKLKSLQNLSAFHPEKDSVNGMMPLKNLPLCGSLKVLNLENVKSKVEAAEAMLNQKKNLNELEFGWSGTSSSTENSNTCKEVLEGLEPHSSLETLRVIGYQGVDVASWMVKENWLPGLRTLELSSCKSLKEVPFLPPCLENLIVENCDELMQIPPVGNTLCTLRLQNCPKLMQIPPVGNTLCTLRLQNCPKLMLPGSNKSLRLKSLNLEGFPNLQTLPNLSPTMTSLWIVNCPKLTSLGNLQYCRDLTIKKCPMLMRDEALLVEGDIINPLSQIEYIITDEPLLVLVLVPQQAFSSIISLNLYGLQRPFPPLLDDHFHQLSSLLVLILNGFTTLPNLENLTSLEILRIYNCPDVELLPNLPISLRDIYVRDCPKLKVNYEEGGRLRHTISHIPHIDI